jgi:hypothetical protein
MKSAFISHSWHDKPLAKQIADTLQRLGGRVWLDDAEIKLGDSLIEKIRAGIDSVDYVIALVSENSVSSRWVSKELDIAMNQEIEGRRLKVLPILASKCLLPGFLTGKLYADMSTPKAYRTSLPMLLDRLEAPADALSKARRGESVDQLLDTSWVRDLGAGLRSDDPSTRYQALKAARTWRAESLLSDLNTLEAVFGLLDETNPPHFRLRALKLIQGIKDDAFAYRVTPLLSDPDAHVVSGALDCLAELRCETAAPKVLELLEETKHPQVRTHCLGFFSKIRVREESVVLSLATICDELMNANSRDEGLKLAVAKAYANQLTLGAAVSLLPRVLEELDSGSDAIRLNLLEHICEKGEELWIPYAPDLRSRLGRAIIESGKSKVPRIAATSWLAALLLPDVTSELANRDALWNQVRKGDEAALQCWFERLGDYRLEALFDQPVDVDGLRALYGRFEGRLNESVCDALCEVGKESALEFMSEVGYEPKGWRKVTILRRLAQLTDWKPELEALLASAARDLPPYVGSEGVAWALVARHKAGALDLDSLLDQFPRAFSGKYQDADRDRKQLNAALDKLKANCDARTKRRIATAARRLDA